MVKADSQTTRRSIASRPCAKCGSEAEIVVVKTPYGDHYQGKCRKCRATGAMSTTRQHAGREWSVRQQEILWRRKLEEQAHA